MLRSTFALLAPGSAYEVDRVVPVLHERLNHAPVNFPTVVAQVFSEDVWRVVGFPCQVQEGSGDLAARGQVRWRFPGEAADQLAVIHHRSFNVVGRGVREERMVDDDQVVGAGGDVIEQVRENDLVLTEGHLAEVTRRVGHGSFVDVDGRDVLCVKASHYTGQDTGARAHVEDTLAAVEVSLTLGDQPAGEVL